MQLIGCFKGFNVLENKTSNIRYWPVAAILSKTYRTSLCNSSTEGTKNFFLLWRLSRYRLPGSNKHLGHFEWLREGGGWATEVGSGGHAVDRKPSLAGFVNIISAGNTSQGNTTTKKNPLSVGGQETRALKCTTIKKRRDRGSRGNLTKHKSQSKHCSVAKSNAELITQNKRQIME